MARGLLLTRALASHARPLRAVFDERFADPRSTRADRFVWDYWHVPGQYTALRTPAWTYFPQAAYRRFHEALVGWGRATLGCHDVSPPWLSCYVDGGEQRLHGDLPHGPWAFVYSLTPWARRAFTGGETLVLREEVLDYWHDFRSTRGLEEPDVVRAIAPQLGQLTVFDPRLPHGVRRVGGTHDPRAGRLVVHGWFVSPRPFIEGPLPARALAARLDALTPAVTRAVGAVPLAGLLSLEARVAADGAVTSTRVLSDNTRVPAVDEPARRRAVAALRRELAAWRFGRQRRPSRLTIPLVFERG
ncbi:MAG: hypothetical protein R2939_06115 [Kofleriaceae bacterium]